MERLTTNKDVSEMNMTELAYNSCYAKDGCARYRDYDTDMDARELAIRLLDRFADIPNEFTCDEDFDDFILNATMYRTGDICGLIAIFYRNLWAMADLRERLKEYEDIGLTPRQLLEIDKLYAEKCMELEDLRKSPAPSEGGGKIVMDKDKDDMREYVCDTLCKFRDDKYMSQEELEAICADCKLENYSISR